MATRKALSLSYEPNIHICTIMLVVIHYVCYSTVCLTLPEDILVADGDGRKVHVVSVDDLDVDGLRITVEEHEAIRHEPEEEAGRQHNHTCPQHPATGNKQRDKLDLREVMDR